MTSVVAPSSAGRRSEPGCTRSFSIIQGVALLSGGREFSMLLMCVFSVLEITCVLRHCSLAPALEKSLFHFFCRVLDSLRILYVSAVGVNKGANVMKGGRR